MFYRLEHVRNENRRLREELNSRLLLNEQLQKNLADHRQEVNELVLCLTRLKNAMNSERPFDAAIVINFPKGPFTVEELQAANSTVCRDDVIMHLAYHVSLRHVNFSAKIPNDESATPGSDQEKLIPFIYQVASEFRLARRAA